MLLSENPFYLLQVSVRDPRALIVERANQRALVTDPDRCQEARATLTTPRLRLGAEIAWLPGVSPSRAHQLAQRAVVGDLNIVRSLNGIPDLAACNLLASAVQRLSSDGGGVLMTQCVWEMALRFERVEPLSLMQLLNEDRGVAGVVDIPNEAAVSEALGRQRHTLVQSLRTALDRLVNPDAVLSDLISRLTSNCEEPVPRLVEDLTARYQVDVQRYLDELRDAAVTLIDTTLEGLSRTKGRLPSLPADLKKLEGVLREWHRIALPIMLVAKTRGSEDETCAALGFHVRQLGLSLWNDHDRNEEARGVATLASELFALLPQLSVRFGEDLQAIGEVFAKTEKTHQERLEWEREIALDIMNGTDRLTISGEAITHRGQAIPTAEVDRLRWGVYKYYLNGIRMSREFTIWVGYPQLVHRIECAHLFEPEKKVLERYSIIIDKLWGAVGVRLVKALLMRLSQGETVQFGEAVVARGGVTLRKRKFLGSEPISLPWEELSISNGPGFFRIQAQKIKNTYVDLEYRTIDNVPVLENTVRFLWKDGNHARLAKGEFH